jgi:hypothetical protein
MLVGGGEEGVVFGLAPPKLGTSHIPSGYQVDCCRHCSRGVFAPVNSGFVSALEELSEKLPNEKKGELDNCSKISSEIPVDLHVCRNLQATGVAGGCLSLSYWCSAVIL